MEMEYIDRFGSQMSELETNLEIFVPSSYVTFTIGNPLPRPFPPAFHSPNLRVSVIDSPSAASSSSNNTVAVILVPSNRESDWIFSTEAGLLQLLLAHDEFSRLIAISVYSPHIHRPTSFKPLASPLEISTSQLEEHVDSLLFKLSPYSLFPCLPPDGVIPFLTFEDNVKCISVLEIRFGPCVGEMVVEDVELNSFDNNINRREFRRRLRFKRMPNYIQSQIRILSENESDLNDEMEDKAFKLDSNGLLIQPYLSPMVAGLSVISSFLASRIQSGLNPRTLCLGIGGGALVTFLSTQLGFEVVGVEEDEEVLNIARKYFALENNSEQVHCFVGDGIKLMNKCTCNVKEDLGGKFDVIMVDLDSSDAKHGSSAPPLEFFQRDVLLGVRERIVQSGVLILNLIAPNKSFYEKAVSELLEVFKELYKIDAGNEENVVFIASVSETQIVSDDEDNFFLKKLKSITDESYILSMRKIQETPHH